MEFILTGQPELEVSGINPQTNLEDMLREQQSFADDDDVLTEDTDCDISDNFESQTDADLEMAFSAMIEAARGEGVTAKKLQDFGKRILQFNDVFRTKLGKNRRRQ